MDLGARPAKVFFRITLPLIVPALRVGLAAGVHAFVGRPGDLAVRRRPGLEHAADGDFFQGAPRGESGRERAGDLMVLDRGLGIVVCRSGCVIRRRRRRDVQLAAAANL